MDETTMFIGLDVHKATIAVVAAEGGRRESARYFGEIENSSAALSKQAKKYGRTNVQLSFCYEAGPCGYGVHRHLIGLGHECQVVAPSLIPKRVGDRVKTDPKRCRDVGATASSRRTERGLGAGRGSRGNARSGSGPVGRGARPAPGASATTRLLVAARPCAQWQSVDADTQTLADDAAL